MSDYQLQQARQALEDAVRTANDGVRDPLRDTAAAFAELAAEDRDADRAVFDDHLNTLRLAEERVEGKTARHVERALEHAEEYREGLSQS